METATLKTQTDGVIRNVSKIPDSELNRLCDVFISERVKRGFLEPAEIEAARSLFETLTEGGNMSPDEATAEVIEAAKYCGYELTAEDFV